jgi:hypothetical protein
LGFLVLDEHLKYSFAKLFVEFYIVTDEKRTSFVHRKKLLSYRIKGVL